MSFGGYDLSGTGGVDDDDYHATGAPASPPHDRARLAARRPSHDLSPARTPDYPSVRRASLPALTSTEVQPRYVGSGLQQPPHYNRSADANGGGSGAIMGGRRPLPLQGGGYTAGTGGAFVPASIRAGTVVTGGSSTANATTTTTGNGAVRSRPALPAEAGSSGSHGYEYGYGYGLSPTGPTPPRSGADAKEAPGARPRPYQEQQQLLPPVLPPLQVASSPHHPGTQQQPHQQHQQPPPPPPQPQQQQQQQQQQWQQLPSNSEALNYSGGGGGSGSFSPQAGIPIEMIGMQELIDFVFSPDQFHTGTYTTLSPSGLTLVPRPADRGLPLVLEKEPVNPKTGRRLVYLSRSEPPAQVRAEARTRFVALTFANAAPRTGVGSNSSSISSGGWARYGTVLGYSDDNTQLVWQDRSQRFASMVSVAGIATVHCCAAVQCKHCGQVLLLTERVEHLATHKRGSGLLWGVYSESPGIGTMCGDTGLLRCLDDPRMIGEGAQGTIELCDVRRPTDDEAAALAEAVEAGVRQGALTGAEAGAQLGLAAWHPSDQLAPTSSSINKTSGGRGLASAVVKTMRMATAEEGEAQYQKAVRIMANIKHPHIVEYLGVHLLPDGHTLRIAMPFYEEGDLSGAIRDCQAGRFEESLITSIALQLSLALSCLHERNPPLVHGDIKVENVMFYNSREQIVLMDLDASCEVVSRDHVVNTSVGTAAYMAPETMNNERLMPASDMWSLGVLLYVLAAMPQFPMILNPDSGEEVMFNADEWASSEDQAAIAGFQADMNSHVLRGGALSTSRRPYGSGGGLLQPQQQQALEGETGSAASISLGSLDSAALNRGVRPPPAGRRNNNRGGMSLSDCVRTNVARRRYSPELTQLIVDLLSYDPHKRPRAAAVGERLTDIMTSNLLGGV